MGRGPPGRGRAHATGPPPRRRRHGRAASRGPQRAHGRPRVRRRRVVGARRRGVVHRLGRPAPVPARARLGARSRSPPSRPGRAATATPTASSAPTAPGSSASASGTTATAPRTSSTRSCVLDARAPGEPRGARHRARTSSRPRGAPPDGATLAWLQWNHPAMPWDAAELVVRDLATGEETVVAGGPGESVTRAAVAARRLAVVPLRPHRLVEPLPLAARPRHRGRGPHRRRHRRARMGVRHLPLRRARRRAGGRGALARRVRRPGRARPSTASLTDLDLPFTAVGAVVAAGPDAVVVVAGSPAAEPGVHRIDLSGRGPPARGDRCAPPRDLGLGADADLRAGGGAVPVGRRRRRVAHRPRAVLPAGQPALPGSGGRAAAAARRDPRRSDVEGVAGAGRRRAVLDQPRLRGGRRRLRRLVGLRPPLPRAAARPVGRRRRRRLPRRRPGARRTAAGPTRTGCASAAARRAATPRWRRWPAPTHRSRPAPTTSASPTSRRWPATPTSSRAATSTAWSGRTRRRATSTWSARRSRTSSGSPGR